MGLIRKKIGEFVELYNEKCNIPNLTIYDVSGINREKEFIEPSKQVGNDTSDYKIVPPNYFACNLMHVGRDVVLPISLNTTSKNKIVSPAYTIFKINSEEIILKEFFFMYLKSDEKDRFFWFHTDSSVRDGLSWEAFCDLEIEIPNIEIQKKYVEIYKAMKNNLKAYQANLEDIKLVYDVFLENLRKDYQKIKLKSVIVENEIENTKLKYSHKDVLGVSSENKIIPTKANTYGNDLSKFIIFNKKDFIYNPRCANAIAINNLKDGIISWNNIAFHINKEYKFKLLPDFLIMYFTRQEYGRWAKYNSWGSSTEVLSFKDICEYEISIPPIEQQEYIVKIYEARINRTNILEKIINNINHICPILIAGAVKEARENE